MSKLISLAVFDNPFEVKYNLLIDMLKEAGINYLTTNDNFRTVRPMPYTTPSNVAIEVKVYEEDLEQAFEIMKSIS